MSRAFHKLGEKMFTRIKDPKEQELLRAFLAARRQGKSEGAATAQRRLAAG